MVYDNSPALSWIRISGGIVTYNNKIYILTDFCTEKKYVYWNAENPSTYETSNEILKETHTKFLVLINDGGMHTIVRSKSDNFNISFDGVKKRDELNKEKLSGLYKAAEDTTEKIQKKFSAIEQNLDGITQIVGQYDADTKKSVSEIKQNMNSIQMSVETQQTSMDSMKTTISNNGSNIESVQASIDEQKANAAKNKLRDGVISKFLDLVNFLGSYEATIQSIMRDGRLSLEGEKNAEGINEREAIKESHATLRLLTERLVKILNEVADNEEFKKKIPLQIEALKNTTIPGIEKSTENLINMVNTVSTDGIFEPLDMKQVFALIERYIADMVKHKDNVDKILVLGYGGEIISTVSKMFLTENQGGFSFSRRINDTVQKATDLKISLDGVSSTVREQAGRISSLSGDIDDTRDSLTGEIGRTRNSLTGEIGKTRDSLTGEIGRAKTELSGEINQAREYFSSEISQTKDSIRTKVDNSRFKSEITQLSQSIENKVSSREVESYLRQGPRELQYGFNALGERFGASFKMTEHGLTINNGYVSTSSLTAPTGSQAIIGLFHNEYGENPFGEVYADLNSTRVETSSSYRGRSGYKTVELLPRIDARDTTGTDYGQEIRLQISQSDYIKVRVNSFEVYQVSGKGPSGVVFSADREGAYVYPNGVRTKLSTDSGGAKTRIYKETNSSDGASVDFGNGQKIRLKENSVGFEMGKNQQTYWQTFPSLSSFNDLYRRVSSLERSMDSIKSRVSRVERNTDVDFITEGGSAGVSLAIGGGKIRFKDSSVGLEFPDSRPTFWSR